MARRANKKLIVMLAAGSVALGAVGGVGYWYKFVYTKNPLPHVQAGDKFMEEGKYEQAVTEYATAIRKKDIDPNVWVKFGDAQNYLAGEDFDNLLKAAKIWTEAVVKNPRLLPAHQRLMQFHIDMSNASQGPARIAYIERAVESAKKVLRQAPDDKKAKIFIQIAPIDQWIAGQITDPETINKSIAELQKLQAEYPEAAEITYAIARAQAFQGQEALKRRDMPEVTRLLDEATKTMADAVAARPDDPHLLIRQAQLIMGIGPRVEDMAVRDEVVIRQKYGQVNKEALKVAQKARELVKPDDEEYVEIMRYTAVRYEGDQNRKEAENVLRELMRNRPDEFAARLQLAEILRSGGQLDEAIKLLAESPTATTVKPGVAGQVAREAERRAMYNLADYRLDQVLQLRAQKKTEEADAALKDAEQLLAKATQKEPDSPRTLRLRGKLELFKGETVKATETLRRGLTQVNDVNDRTRYELMYLLARAKLITSQTGDAEDLLREIVDRLDFPVARLELARLLLQRGELDEAGQQIDALRASDPTNPEVVALILAHEEMSIKKIDPKTFADTWNQLPEKTVSDRVKKGRLAMAAGQPERSLPLFEALHKEMPDQSTLVALLASNYEKLNQNDKAIALLNAHIAKFPESPGLRIMLEQIMGKSAADIDNTRIEIIEQIPDPLQRNLVKYEFYRRRNNNDEMEKAFAELMKLAPDDKRVIDLRFTRALSTGDFTAAERLLEPISKLDVDNAGGRLARSRLLLARAGAESNPDKRAAAFQSAIDSATELSRERGEYGQAWVILGQANFSAGRLEDAITAFSQALERQSENAEALEGLIRCNYLLKRERETKQYIDRARKIFPNSQLFIEYSVSWDVQYGNPMDAVAVREKNLADNPNSPLAYGNLGAALAAAAEAEPDKEKAKALRERSRQVFADGVKKFPLELNLVAAYADLARLTERGAEGEAAWRTLLADSAFKDRPDVAVRFASFYRVSNRLDDAIAYLLEFVGRVPDPTVRATLADLYQVKGQDQEALKQLELAGDAPAAIKRRSELLLTAGKRDEARETLVKGIERHPRSTELRNRLAFILITDKEEDKARQLLAESLAIEPNNGESLFFVAMLDSQAGKLDEALAGLNRVMDVMPDNTDAMKLSAELLKRRNNANAAAEVLEDVLIKTPNDKGVRIQLIELYLSMVPPRLVDAERLWREGRSNPAMSQDLDLIHAGARILYVKGDLKASMEMLRVSLQGNPGNLPMQDTYFRILIASKEYDTAIQAATILMQKFREPWILSLRGSAYAKKNEVEKAMADFEAGYNLAMERGDQISALNMVRTIQIELGAKAALQFLEPRAKDDNSKVLLAQLSAEAGEVDKAVSIVEEMYARRDQLKSNQRLAMLKFLGTLYLSQATPDVPKAKKVYDEYLASAPNDFAVLNNVAYLLLLPESGARANEAVEYAKRAFDGMTASNQVDANILDTYGVALIRAGQINTGLNRLREAIQRQPSTESYIHLAEGLIANGETAEAAGALDQAEELLKKLETEPGWTPAQIAQLKTRIGEWRSKISN